VSYPPVGSVLLGRFEGTRSHERVWPSGFHSVMLPMMIIYVAARGAVGDVELFSWERMH
jgi:hypothetical protein